MIAPSRQPAHASSPLIDTVDQLREAQHLIGGFRLKQRRDQRLAKEQAAGRCLPGSRPDYDALIAQAEADLTAARTETDTAQAGSGDTPAPDNTPGTDLVPYTSPGNDVAARDTPGTSLVPYTSPGNDVAVRDTPGTDLVPQATVATGLALRPGCDVEHLPSAAVRGNATDPDSRVLKTRRGWIQGYNCQAAVVRVQHGRRLVLAAEVTQDANDMYQGVPMMNTAVANAERAGLGTPELFALDAGYWSQENLTAEGPDRLIAPGKNRTMLAELRTNGYATGPAPPDASPADQMRHRLRTQGGAESYAQRAPTVEPLFGDTKHNRGITAFQRRGKPAADNEWKLIHATTNLRTLHRHTRDLGHGSLHATITHHTHQTNTETG